MAIQQQSKALRRIVDYLMFVGPDQKKGEQAVVASHCDASEPTVLRQFPMQCHSDCCVSVKQVASFCQPHSTCTLGDCEIQRHIFMLTDTETNNRLYGVCRTFSYEIDTLRSHISETVAKETITLSICILSQHLLLNFFKGCLEALAKLVEVCHDYVTWLNLLYPELEIVSDNTKSKCLVSDIENWINKLLSLELPQSPAVELEVMADLGRPLSLRCPSSRELPLSDLSARQLFQHLRPHKVNQILQLILNEQKVVICSRKHDVVAQTVLTLISLIYPLEYVYPLIPLLPSRLSQAADLLMVPVPYVIGTSADLISKLSSSNLEDAYVVDLDTKEIKSPEFVEECLPQLPMNSLELQANIKKLLDGIQPYALVKDNMVVVEYRDADKIEALIWHEFLKFMMSPQMLGLLSRHRTIIRLFPRSVVELQSSCLLESYTQQLQHESTDFIKKFITSQSVGCFLDWNLNPTNMIYLQPLSGCKMSQDGVGSVHNSEKISVSLLDDDSSLHGVLLHASAINPAADSCSDSFSDEDDYQCPPSPWTNQLSPNKVIPEIRQTRPVATTQTWISDHTYQQWVEKLLQGKGISFTKAQHSQVLASDPGRTKLILLVERGLWNYEEGMEVLHNSVPMEVSSVVFNRLLSLAKTMMKNIDGDFFKSQNGCLLSAFLLLRFTCVVSMHSNSVVKATAAKKTGNEMMLLKSRVLSCGDNTTPYVSSVSSYTSSSDEDDVANDLTEEVTSACSVAPSRHVNKRFLCHELFVKPPSPSSCLASNQFWKTVFSSAVTMLRNKLGWNEKTAELYQRYSSDGDCIQQEMSAEEDKLLNSVLANLATFMSIAGVNIDKSKQLITNLATHCRLGESSEATTAPLERMTNWENISLTPLYMKRPLLLLGHLGNNKSGTACKVEVWDNVVVLRRVSDGELMLRIWRDHIKMPPICDANNELVAFHYHNDAQPPTIIHSKQFRLLHETIVTCTD